MVQDVRKCKPTPAALVRHPYTPGCAAHALSAFARPALKNTYEHETSTPTCTGTSLSTRLCSSESGPMEHAYGRRTIACGRWADHDLYRACVWQADHVLYRACVQYADDVGLCMGTGLRGPCLPYMEQDHAWRGRIANSEG
eukprot:1160142-Pelagomonas_calceolata.AAC.31